MLTARCPGLATAYVEGPSLADGVSQYGPLPPGSVLALTPPTMTAAILGPTRGQPEPAQPSRRPRRRPWRPLAIASITVGLVAGCTFTGVALTSGSGHTVSHPPSSPAPSASGRTSSPVTATPSPSAPATATPTTSAPVTATPSTSPTVIVSPSASASPTAIASASPSPSAPVTTTAPANSASPASTATAPATAAPATTTAAP